MTVYQRLLASRAPLHMETLAFDIGSTLDGMPAAFFDDIADLARRMGAAALAERHARAVTA